MGCTHRWIPQRTPTAISVTTPVRRARRRHRPGPVPRLPVVTTVRPLGGPIPRGCSQEREHPGAGAVGAEALAREDGDHHHPREEREESREPTHALLHHGPCRLREPPGGGARSWPSCG